MIAVVMDEVLWGLCRVAELAAMCEAAEEREQAFFEGVEWTAEQVQALRARVVSGADYVGAVWVGGE